MNQIAEMETRAVFELADGMRHWWNDDNPEADQREAYRLLLTELTTPGYQKYILDLEECVRVLYQRYENAQSCWRCQHGATEHFCPDMGDTFTEAEVGGTT